MRVAARRRKACCGRIPDRVVVVCVYGGDGGGIADVGVVQSKLSGVLAHVTCLFGYGLMCYECQRGSQAIFDF